MDYDNDGVLDFISGSYDPGDIWLFRGTGGGRYEKGQQILDKSGQPVVHHPAEFAKYTKLKDDGQADEEEKILARVASFGSWPAPVDWDADGDLDLLIGSFQGELFRRVNEGRRDKPVYANDSIPVVAHGKPVKVHAHANPVVADWDADGLWDLVISSGDGSIGWYQNVGTKTEPSFGPQQPLITRAAESKFLEQFLKPGQAPVPGVRAQICVTDYNNDGRLDLIVGDYSEINWTKELTPQEQDELQQLRDSNTDLTTRMREGREKTDDKNADSATKKKHEEAHHALMEEYLERLEQIKGFYAESRSASFVWLYLRDGSGEKGSSPDSASRNASAPAENEKKPAGSTNGGNKKGPVSIEARIERLASDARPRFRLSVEVEMKRGWHVYSAKPAGSAVLPIELDLHLPDELRRVGEWQRPPGTPSVDDPKLAIYEGTVTFTQNLELAAGTNRPEVKVDVRYQVCNDKACLPPKTVSVVVPPLSAD